MHCWRRSRYKTPGTNLNNSVLEEVCLNFLAKFFGLPVVGTAVGLVLVVAEIVGWLLLDEYLDDDEDND